MRIIFLYLLFTQLGFAIDFLSDPENRVSNEFKVTPFYRPYAKFWFDVYTKYNSKTIIIHDRFNPNLVYAIIDGNQLTNPSVIDDLSNQKVLVYKKGLLALANDLPNIAFTDHLKHLITSAGLVIPKSQKSKRAFFWGLAKSIRLQTGQADNISAGLVRFRHYKDYLEEMTTLFNLPKEILAIPFVESSFRFDVESKVGAYGLWQIMPSIGNKLLPTTSLIDGRSSPVFSSIAAFHLIKSNFRLLNAWDLTVTAYNSGTKHLVIAKELFSGAPPLTLEKIIKFYQHPHLGFAAKNFYSEFLAMVHVLAYSNHFDKNVDPLVGSPKIQLFLSKCDVQTVKLFKLPNHLEYNRHFEKIKIIPRGSIIASDRILDLNKYILISPELILQRFPKNLSSLITDYKCSTK